MTVNCKWTWDRTYQRLYDRTQNIIKKNVTISIYNEKHLLYLETDASGVSLEAHLLQARDGMQFPRNETPDNAVLWPIAFTTKSLKSAEIYYSNKE